LTAGSVFDVRSILRGRKIRPPKAISSHAALEEEMGSEGARAKTYEVHHDPDRKRQGLSAWAIVEAVDGSSWRIISRHSTMQDAPQTKTALETSGAD
jgi:hypothetical protein